MQINFLIEFLAFVVMVTVYSYFRQNRLQILKKMDCPDFFANFSLVLIDGQILKIYYHFHGKHDLSGI